MPLNYDVVLFDADDTLFDFYRAETYALESTLSSFGYDASVSSYMDAFRTINHQVWHEYESGTITSQEVRVKRFVLLLAELGLSFDPDDVSVTYVARLGEASFMVPGARELLDALDRRVPLGLVTNGISDVQRSRLARSGLGDYFQAIVISDEVEIQKPDPAIFALALERVGATPTDRVVMIGDGLNSDIKGAIAAGIDSCWVNLRARAVNPEVTPTYTVDDLSGVYGVLGIG